MPIFTVLLFFIIFLEVSIFSLCYSFLSIYFGNENASFALILETLLTSVFAYHMLKQQGLKSFIDFQKVGQLGSSPESILLSQLTKLISAILLIVPGILTDISGLLLLCPPINKKLFGRMRKSTHHSIFTNVFQSSTQWREPHPQHQYRKKEMKPDDIIDVEVEDLSQRSSK
ncbi:MAG: FxsA family protein [Oligoflexales bacterium]